MPRASPACAATSPTHTSCCSSCASAPSRARRHRGGPSSTRASTRGAERLARTCKVTSANWVLRPVFRNRNAAMPHRMRYPLLLGGGRRRSRAGGARVVFRVRYVHRARCRACGTCRARGTSSARACCRARTRRRSRCRRPRRRCRCPRRRCRRPCRRCRRSLLRRHQQHTAAALLSALVVGPAAARRAPSALVY